MLDHNFNLKLIDFGVAAPLGGTCGSDALRAKVGTPAYMVPEMLRGGEYSGVHTDVFAAGVVLFFMLTQRMPFAVADPDKDPLYRLLISGESEHFWNIHAQLEYNTCIHSDEFRRLFEQMMRLEPEGRLKIDEIRAQPWMLQELPTCAQIKQ